MNFKALDNFFSLYLKYIRYALVKQAFRCNDSFHRNTFQFYFNSAFKSDEQSFSFPNFDLFSLACNQRSDEHFAQGSEINVASFYTKLEIIIKKGFLSSFEVKVYLHLCFTWRGKCLISWRNCACLSSLVQKDSQGVVPQEWIFLKTLVK